MEYASGNIFQRQMIFAKAGDVVQGHAHNFDHVTFVCMGGVRIERKHPDGREDSIEVMAGEPGVLIKAECIHKLTALTDGTTAFCIYAHRTPQGDVVQRYTGWQDAYV